MFNKIKSNVQKFCWNLPKKIEPFAIFIYIVYILIKSKSSKVNAREIKKATNAFYNMFYFDLDIHICTIVGIPSALTALAYEKAVKEDSVTASNVAYALCKIAESESGRQACINAGATLALVSLSGEKAVKGNGVAAGNVAAALSNIAKSESGRQSCIKAGATLALISLFFQKSILIDASTRTTIIGALWNLFFNSRYVIYISISCLVLVTAVWCSKNF
jgi:hypothetical protein